jgi:hypothetical protein
MTLKVKENRRLLVRLISQGKIHSLDVRLPADNSGDIYFKPRLTIKWDTYMIRANNEVTLIARENAKAWPNDTIEPAVSSPKRRQ